ncbi:hypothetical protein M3J09_012901 [Ascochyta lentis]
MMSRYDIQVGLVGRQAHAAAQRIPLDLCSPARPPSAEQIHRHGSPCSQFRWDSMDLRSAQHVAPRRRRRTSNAAISLQCMVSLAIIIVEWPENIENWSCGVPSQSNIVRHRGTLKS